MFVPVHFFVRSKYSLANFHSTYYMVDNFLEKIYK